MIGRMVSHYKIIGKLGEGVMGIVYKVRKASLEAFPLRIVEQQPRPIPSKGWAEMIRKVHKVEPMFCPHSLLPGGRSG